MDRYVRDHRAGDRGLPTVKHIEISSKHPGLRLAAAIVLLLVGAGAIAYSISGFLTTADGWQEISVNSDAGVNCSGDFTLNYDLGASGVTAGTENRAIMEIYSTACHESFQLFNSDTHYDGVVNVWDLNQNPNTEMEVSPVLYETFSLMEESGTRILYYGPLYQTLSNVYSCEADVQAKEIDPAYSEESAEDFAAMLSYIGDPDAVQLELLGDYKVCLHVSEDYLKFAEEDGIESFIDLFPVQNGFIADYIADALISAGYTRGVLTSYDGYVRYLGGEELEAEQQVYEKSGKNVSLIDTVTLTGVSSIVSLHDFPIADAEQYNYYVYEDGSVCSQWILPDGSCGSAVSSMTFWSEEASCGEILKDALAVWLSGSLDTGRLAELGAEGIHALYAENGAVVEN